MKKRERVYLQKIVDLGCIVCTKLGYHDTPAEIHHIKRFGAKRDHSNVIHYGLVSNLEHKKNY